MKEAGRGSGLWQRQDGCLPVRGPVSLPSVATSERSSGCSSVLCSVFTTYLFCVPRKNAEADFVKGRRRTGRKCPWLVQGAWELSKGDGVRTVRPHATRWQEFGGNWGMRTPVPFQVSVRVSGGEGEGQCFFRNIHPVIRLSCAEQSVPGTAPWGLSSKAQSPSMSLSQQTDL